LRLAVSLALVLCTACQREDSPPAEPPSGLAVPPPARPKPGDVVELLGVTVKYLDHGAIQIVGKDRWGAPFDTTYESPEYLRKALPTLERSLAPAQTSALRRQIMQ
jgi:hypothetical protein